MKLVTAKPPLYPNITVNEIQSCLPHLYEPDAKLLASNVYFHSMMSAINHLANAVGDFSLTDEEKKTEIKRMRANMKSASWVSALYGALSDPDGEEDIELSGSK